MPPRAMWTGQLRLSLVSLGVRMYSATESSGRVSMNQLHAGCNQRIRYQTTCPIHGPVSRDEIVKGYEYKKDSYVLIDEEDLEAIRLTSSKTIDLVQFVNEGEIDPLFIESPYFIGPDGAVAEEAFRVIREAMRKSKTVGIGKLVIRSRENIVALRPEGNGLLLTTLRYAEEVRKPEQFFSDIKNGKVDKEQLELATSIIDKKTKAFDAAAFTDEYREKFFELVKAKVAGTEPVLVEEEEAPQAYSFMDALQRSVQQESGQEASKKKSTSTKSSKKKTKRKPAAKSVSKTTTRKKQQRKRA